MFFFVMHDDSVISILLSRAMGFWASHSGIIKEITDQSVYTIETSDFHVEYRDFNRYLVDPNVSYEVYRLPIKNDERLKVVDASAQTYGIGYGYFQLFSFYIRILAAKLGIRIKNFIRWGVVCCHVVLYGYKESSIKELNSIDPESIMTKEMYDIIRAIPGVKLVATNRN